MAKPVCTYDLAMAAGRDEADRSMKAAGRSRWSREDYNHAVRTFARLYPQREQIERLGAASEARERVLREGAA